MVGKKVVQTSKDIISTKLGRFCYIFFIKVKNLMCISFVSFLVRLLKALDGWIYIWVLNHVCVCVGAGGASGISSQTDIIRIDYLSRRQK